MAIVTKPPALDESVNTTEQNSRNIADVLAQELSGIASAITGGSDKAPKTDIATVEPTNTASRAYSVGELVYVNGNLYKVITAIVGGATFTVGTNIQSTNVSDAVKKQAVEYFTLDTNTTEITDASVICNYCFYDPESQIVSLHYLVYSANQLIPAEGVTIATVPAKYRPKLALSMPFALITRSDFQTLEAQHWRIEISGEIQCTTFIIKGKKKIFSIDTIYSLA